VSPPPSRATVSILVEDGVVDGEPRENHSVMEDDNHSSDMEDISNEVHQKKIHIN
jgi:hypothetical protein